MQRRTIPRGLAAGGLARRMGNAGGKPAPSAECAGAPSEDISRVLGSIMSEVSAGLGQLGTILQKAQRSTEGGGHTVDLGTPGNKLVFGYTVRVGNAGVSAEPFGSVAPAGGAVSSAQSVSRAAASRQPIVDVFEEDSDIVVIAELPGVSEQDIACTVTGMSLRIETTGAHAYAKDVALPGRTDPAALSYRCQNGILEVRLRRVSTPS